MVYFVSPIMQAKDFFVSLLHNELHLNGESRMLDLGSGQSRSFLPFLERFPTLTYIGVEPSRVDAAVARDLLKPFPNARIYDQLAYEPIAGEPPFDLVVSLSVLEHVKQLERFLSNSVAMAKSGGHIVHRYDLGHALHPSSLKEQLQVFLGNTFPWVLPEHKFVSYVDPDHVALLLERHGASAERVTYHQMPNHKRFLKEFHPSTAEAEILANALSEWELSASPHLGSMSKRSREELFPTIAIWALKE
jgi:2-polyprenyl-3-methyl-5-hydroxy-6-metoxy-1,4-benzoquinol methylase